MGLGPKLGHSRFFPNLSTYGTAVSRMRGTSNPPENDLARLSPGALRMGAAIRSNSAVGIRGAVKVWLVVQIPDRLITRQKGSYRRTTGRLVITIRSLAGHMGDGAPQSTVAGDLANSEQLRPKAPHPASVVCWKVHCSPADYPYFTSQRPRASACDRCPNNSPKFEAATLQNLKKGSGAGI